MTFSTEDKLKCLRREIALRKSAYPKWVGSGRMTQEVADREITIMLEIHHDIEIAPQIEMIVGGIIENLSETINALLDMFPQSDMVLELKQKTAEVITAAKERLST